VSEFIPPQSAGSFSFDASTIVLEDIIATILDIVVKAWPLVITRGKVASYSEEDEITDALRWEMDGEKKRRTPVPHLRFERETQSDLPDEERGIGYIDVHVIYSFEVREYFAIECKRVADSDAELSRYYVSRGVVRFVKGKYSLLHPYAAMIGYVCTGQCASVAEQIEKRVTEYDRDVTALSDEWLWRREERFGSVPHLFSTKHAQSGVHHDITLLHLFLGFAN
jgi:hypothetical protein